MHACIPYFTWLAQAKIFRCYLAEAARGATVQARDLPVIRGLAYKKEAIQSRQSSLSARQVSFPSSLFRVSPTLLPSTMRLHDIPTLGIRSPRFLRHFLFGHQRPHCLEAAQESTPATHPLPRSNVVATSSSTPSRNSRSQLVHSDWRRSEIVVSFTVAWRRW